MSDEILTVQEVAALLKVADKTVYTMAQKGEIPELKVRGQSRFRRADIDAWIRTRRPRVVRKAAVSSQSPLALPVTLAELESHLWEAANILRGSPVDRTDWKSYILPLLFFKRICDVWDEEHAAMLSEYGEDFADEHRFQVPEGCHWSAVRRAPKNVGTALASALRGVEAANQKHLHGVFGDAQWTNKDRLPDELLKDLIEHFSALSLGNARVASDVMGDAYEYLIKQFADATNKKAGEFYTPRSVVRLMVDILDPKEGETVYDPACGTGGMLLAAVAHARERGGDPRTFFGKLHGQEKNLTTAAVARMNLFLHGIEDFVVERGDTLRSPLFTDATTGGLATFDVVIANPPFSLEQWGREVWEADPWGRAFAGLPTDKSGDFAWVQHMVKSMAPKSGRMAVVLPLGVLFHTGEEGKIRRKLLEADLVEGVIALGDNLFYGTGIPACVLVLKVRKAPKLRRKVYFVDAADVFVAGRAQNSLDEAQARQIAGWYQEKVDRPGRTRIVEHEELSRNDWSLYQALYVWNDNALMYASKGKARPPASPREARERLNAAIRRAREAEQDLRALVSEEGLTQ
ncbi:N-6 DNA methylase [Sorangium sp. So ce1389]|uniref:N-6 DNA methylase n=1 Tax=Sorangium sp. So ce1389 TaxID=3133336 RepID=UPI003F614EE6